MENNYQILAFICLMLFYRGWNSWWGPWTQDILEISAKGLKTKHFRHQRRQKQRHVQVLLRRPLGQWERPCQSYLLGGRLPKVELFSACEKLLNKLEKHEVSISFELPNSNRYWTHPRLQAFVQARAPFRSVVHACAMGTEGFPGFPSRKRSG